MLIDQTQCTGAVQTDAARAEVVRRRNEEIAIIYGLADLLVEAGDSFSPLAVRAALESVRRHAGDLRNLMQCA